MRIVAVSDLHGQLPEIPECDILLIAGDIVPPQPLKLSYQKYWLDSAFRVWLDRLPAKEVYGCAGNHDFLFQEEPFHVPFGLKWTYLQDQTVESPLFGIKIHGSPWQRWFGGWAFNAPKDEAQAEVFLAEKYKQIDIDTDIIISHGPPYGYGDSVGSTKTGSKSFMKRIEAIKPKLVVFGHIHVGHGQWQRRWGKQPEPSTIFANVAMVDSVYVLSQEPTIFELEF